MARFAATSRASTIVVCGVHFMAETVKLLCPDKRVLLPNLNARARWRTRSMQTTSVRCGLPIRIYRWSLRKYVSRGQGRVRHLLHLGQRGRGGPSLGRARIIMVPDRHLAGYVARKTGIEVVNSGGECEVHAKFSGAQIAEFRRERHATCSRIRNARRMSSNGPISWGRPPP